MMPTYGRFEVAIVQGKGVVAQDSEGKSYIDFTSGIGVNALGFVMTNGFLPSQNRHLHYNIFPICIIILHKPI